MNLADLINIKSHTHCRIIEKSQCSIKILIEYFDALKLKILCVYTKLKVEIEEIKTIPKPHQTDFFIDIVMKYAYFIFSQCTKMR